MYDMCRYLHLERYEHEKPGIFRPCLVYQIRETHLDNDQNISHFTGEVYDPMPTKKAVYYCGLFFLTLRSGGLEKVGRTGD